MPRPRSSNTTKAKYWLLTIPQQHFVPYPVPGFSYVKGQLEKGENSGYLHWQVLACAEQQCRLSAIKSIFGDHAHAEPSRSTAANAYVWKEETRVEGTQFEFGNRSYKRNDKKDWAAILEHAKKGEFELIPPDVQVRSFGTLQKISAHYARPKPGQRKAVLYWGDGGTGKTHKCYELAGMDCFPKDTGSMYWDGYRGQKNVVFDDFRGDISINYILRVCDKYPMNIPVKGTYVPLECEKVYFSSNIPIDQWYPRIDNTTLRALKRRFEIHHVEFVDEDDDGILTKIDGVEQPRFKPE